MELLERFVPFSIQRMALEEMERGERQPRWHQHRIHHHRGDTECFVEVQNDKRQR